MASCLTIFHSLYRQLFSYRIWWLAILSVLGFYAYLRYDAQVFPSASIDLKVPRLEIIRSARLLANRLGYDQNKAIESTQFTLDNQAKTFLEYELGSDRANALMKDELPVWFWRTRFCREHEQEELRVWLDPSAKLIAFTHELENDKRLLSLTRTDALQLAKDFVKDYTKLSLDSYTLTKSASYKQAHRTDYSFTWQDDSHDFDGAKLRIHVGIAGNQVNQFNYYLYVPESFQRKFSTLRSSNQLLQSIASIFYSLLQVTSVFIFFWAVSTKRIRWRFAISIATLLTIIDILDSFNEIASVIDSYNTETPFSGYFFEFLIDCFVSGMAKFLNSLMLAGAAELIYRISYPKKLALENIFRPKSYRTKAFINGNLIGHCLVGINLGWIVIYYLTGSHWHFWCPLEVENYQVLSSVVPFFSAISTGVSAAISEEFLYRVLALSLFQRLTRSFWLANLFQAVAWGFMHSTYAQEPAYARGLELTVIGLLHGWLLRRYGLLPCLIGHYLFDALISAKMLLGASDFALKSTALIPVVPFFFLLIIALLKIKRWGFKNENPLHNGTLIKLYPRAPRDIIREIKDDLKQTSIIPEETLSYIRTLSKRAFPALFLFAVINLMLIFPFLNYQSVNKDVVLNTSRAQIAAIAKKELALRNISVSKHKVLVTLIDDTNALDMQYVYEKSGLKETLAHAKDTRQGLLWKARFFRPLDPKEYLVWLDMTGKVLADSLVEPEDTAGANLSEDEAKKIAESYLSNNLKDWQPFKFVNSFENKRKSRTDHTLTYTIPHLNVGDAEFRVSMDVLGDTVSGLESGYDLPDRWLNERNQKTFKDEALSYLRTIFKVFIFLAIIFWALGLLRQGYIKWQSAYFSTVLLLVCAFLQHLNCFPQFYSAYSTTEPFYSYVLRQVTGYAQAIQNSFLYNFCFFALALAALRTIAPKFNLRLFMAFLLSPFNRDTATRQKELVLSSWLIAFGIVAFHLLLNVFADFLHTIFSPGCPQESLSTICDLSNMGWPSLAIIVDACIAAFKQIMLIAVLAGLYKRYCPKFFYFAVFVLLFNLITHSSVRYWQDYLIDVIFSSTWEISMWCFIVKLIGVNPLAYFFIGFIDGLLSNSIDLMQHGLPLFIVSVVLACFFILTPVFYALRIYYLQHRDKNTFKVVTG